MRDARGHRPGLRLAGPAVTALVERGNRRQPRAGAGHGDRPVQPVPGHHPPDRGPASRPAADHRGGHPRRRTDAGVPWAVRRAALPLPIVRGHRGGPGHRRGAGTVPDSSGGGAGHPGWLAAVDPGFALGSGFTPGDHAGAAAPGAPSPPTVAAPVRRRAGHGRPELTLRDGRRVRIRGVLGAGFESPTPESRAIDLWLPGRDTNDRQRPAARTCCWSGAWPTGSAWMPRDRSCARS